MISQFGPDTALLLIDVQQGVNDLVHWGGPTGRRNNPDAEARMARLRDCWRTRRLPVIFTQHDSRQAVSPLKLSLPGGAFIKHLAPLPPESLRVFRSCPLITPKDARSSLQMLAIALVMAALCA